MLDELRHFLLILEHGSFTAAARHAHLTQPALSASIRRLELQLDARLLVRHGRGATPSAAGSALAPWAQRALAAVDAGQRAVADIEDLATGEVRVGGGETACTYLLPAGLAAFRSAHPRVRLRLSELWTPQVPGAVLDGRLDLGVAGSLPPELQGDRWYDDALVCVAAPALAAQLRRTSPAGSLPPGTPAVSFPAGTSTRDLLDVHLSDVDVVMELRSFSSVVGLVRAGVGVALLSRAAAAADVQRGSLEVLAHPATPVRRTLWLVHAGVSRLSPAATALRRVLLDQVPGTDRAQFTR